MLNPYLNSRFFNQLDAFNLRFSKELKGLFGGVNLTKSYGSSLEFSDFKEYVLGDDIRQIDWNLYSRFDKPYIKLFNDERQMNTEIYIDISNSMGEPIEKGYYAIALAAQIGYLAVKNLNKVSIFPLQDNKVDTSLSNIATKEMFFKTMNKLNNITFKSDSYISDAIISNYQFNKIAMGLTVIISDFLTDNNWIDAIKYLRYKKRNILLIQVLTKSEVSPNYLGLMNLLDSEADSSSDERNLKLKINKNNYKSYNRAFNEITQNVRRSVERLGGKYIQIITDTPVEKAIFKQLLKVEMI